MAGIIEQRLAELGLELPQAAAAVAAYVPCVRSGNLLFISGQLPMWNGEFRCVGKVGRDISLEDANAAARLCALNLLAQARAACDGDLDRLVRCVKLTGFINAEPEFKDHSKIVNGASELLQQVMGEAGRHARSSIGVGSLPFGAAVEVEAIFEVA
ncbi:Enamine deaminase RidA, house cleaning of reactive enamine intermediates, YjgF/YER057c/UK114 family [uncultured Gammaproteobacteria bacterium]